MICVSCEAENPNGAKFCNECGARLSVKCPACGAANLLTAAACRECGGPLGAGAASVPSGPAASPGLPNRPAEEEAERRQLTVMFCDLVGSTELSGRLDPEDLRSLLRTYHDVSAAAVRAADGYIAQYLGDGLLVYFGYPVAREDNAARAVHAALGIVEAIEHVNPRLQRTKGISLRVRIGIHTGPVVVSDVGGDLRRERLAVGETPNLAARLQGLAAPNTIVISEATHRLAREFFHFRDLGPQSLKGIANPIPTYEVTGRSGARSRLDARSRSDLTPLAGPDEVVGKLLSAWTAAQRVEGPFVLLSGEAGIGKSRHVQALVERVGAEHPALLLGSCVEGAEDTPLTPIVDLLKRQLDADEDATPAERWARIQEACARCGSDAAALVASLLGVPAASLYELPALPPQRMRQATFDAILSWLEDVAAHGPALLVIEDLHWADPSTMELLSLLVQRPPAARLLSLLTARPAFTPPWSESPRFSRVTVSHLRREDAAQIVERITGGREMPPDLLEQILQRAEGVPLYLEEITKNVLESERVQLVPGRVEVRGGLARDLIPPTVQDSLMARLDRLGPGRALAQLAAAIGREFDFELLCALGLLDEDGVRRELDRLLESGIVVPKDEAGKRFEFKHALIRDAAYQSLARSTRQRYHAQILRVLVDRSPDIEERQPELLAQHYAGAGLVGEAIERWQRAGQRATAGAAFREAVAHFKKALEAEAALPPSRERDRREIALRSGLGLALISTQGFASKEVELTYARAVELCAQADEIPYPILYGVWAVVFVRGDREGVHRIVDRVRRLTETSDDPAVQIATWSCLAGHDYYAGRYRDARAHGQRAVDVVARHDPRDLLRSLLNYNSEALFYGHLYAALADCALGFQERASAGAREVIAIAESIDNAYMLTMALSFAATVLELAGEHAEALAMAQRALGMSVANGLPFWTAVAMTTSGMVLLRTGQPHEALRSLRDGYGLVRVLGCTVVVALWGRWIAEALLATDQLDEALRVSDESLAFSEISLAGRPGPPDALFIKGAILLRRGDAAQAEVWMRRGLAAAQAEDARLFELQAASHLAALLAATSRPAEARELLEAAVARLPEGHGRTEHLEAQRILATLP